MTKLIGFLVIVGIYIIIDFVIALPIMWLWNDLNYLFKLPEITWTEAFKLSILSSLLFKSFNSSLSDSN